MPRLVKKHFDKDGVSVTFHYTVCERCGWESEMVVTPLEAGALAAALHDDNKCLNPPTLGAA